MRKLIMTTTAANIAAFANTPAATRVAPVITGIASIAFPERVKPSRGSTSSYPFDGLEVGGSFGLKGKTAKSMSSIVSNQNRKHRAPVLDTDGNPVYASKTMKDAAGVETVVPDITKPKTEQTKQFEAFDVDAEIAKLIKGTPLADSTVIIRRVK